MSVRRHVAVGVLGAGLLVSLVLVPAKVHGALATGVLMVAWFFDREVARGVGRPARWLGAIAVLIALGAWLGPKDVSLAGLRVSSVGAFAAVTMASRAVGILLVTSALTRSVVPRHLLSWLGKTRARSFAASVVVALRIAPELATLVRTHAAEQKRRAPGLRAAPGRWFEVLVASVAHASRLADDVSLELTASATPSRPNESFR